MKTKVKNLEKGITLIALIITIIVLLILASVTLKVVLNSNLIGNAQTAVGKYSEEQAKERLNLALIDYQFASLSGDETASIQKSVENIGGVVLNETEEICEVEIDGYIFEVDKETGEITSLGEPTGTPPTIGEPTINLAEDKHSATITVSASAVNGGTLTVTIDGKVATNNGDGTYTSEAIEKNGTYKIKVEESGNTKNAVKSVKIETIEAIKYTITVNGGANVTVTGGGEIEKGQSAIIKATPSAKYIFEKWNVVSGNTSDIENINSASTKITPTGDITIEAEVYIYMETISDGNNLTGRNSNGTINGAKATYNNPIIPVGFKTVDTPKASWISSNGTTVDDWNKGLVIADDESNGNEFVWVPVDETNVKYEKWCTTGIAYNYNMSDDTIPTKVTSTWGESETSQITKYGGFYVARYEAGIPETLTLAISTATVDERNISGTPVSKKDQVPWNFIDYTHSKTNAERMYNRSDYVQSGLITGTQWDTIMKWFENGEAGCTTNSTSWGNYRDAAVTNITQYAPWNSGVIGANWTEIISSRTKPTSGSEDDYIWLLKAGHSEYTNRNNIYDIAGNLSEWSNEIHSSYCIHRGGFFNVDGSSGNYPAARRKNDLASYTRWSLGFRSVLYIK